MPLRFGMRPGLHGGAAGRAARLRVERNERHAFGRQPVDIRRRHAAGFPAPIGAGVAIAEVVGEDQDDVRFATRWSRGLLRQRCCEGRG